MPVTTVNFKCRLLAGQLGDVMKESATIAPFVLRPRVFCASIIKPITCAGQLGDVMKESATIAHTFARKFLEGLQARFSTSLAAF